MRNSISPSVRIQTLLAFAGSHQQLMQLLQLRIERYQLPYWRSWITSIWMRVSINCEETTSIDFESKPIAREQQFEIFQFRITTSLISSRIYGFIAFIGGKNKGTIPGLREKFAQVLLVQDGTRNTRSSQIGIGEAKKACEAHQPDYKPWAKMATVQHCWNWVTAAMCHEMREV